MPTRLRKTRKMRGSGGCGYGSKKKHRGKGSKGGKGYAGSHKHHYIRTMINEPEHFGKHGFTSLKKLKKEAKIINVGDLEKLSDKAEINLGEMGFTKLLGKGSVSKSLVITVPDFSKEAKEKIEKAGGQIISDKPQQDFEEAAESAEPAAEKAESEEELEEVEEEAKEVDEAAESEDEAE
jgi:large subunit ribosomal protein L15